MTRLSREWRFVAIAVALHLALLLLPHRRPALPTQEPADVPIEVAFEPTQGPQRGGSDTGSIRGVVGSLPTTRTHRSVISATGPVSSAETTFEPAPEGTTDSQGTTLPLVLGPDGLGLGGSHSFTMDVAKQTAPAPDESTRVAETVHQMLAAPVHVDGPITNELERSVRASNEAPLEGHAIFSIRIDETGLVVSATVVEASNDWKGWEDVAKRTLNALAQKQVRVPRGAKGVEMRVELVSEVVYPSGAHHPVSTQLGGTSDPTSSSLPIGSLGFDLSDIGTHPARVAHARVLSETAF